MRLDGTLVKWDDERGFGFIAPAQGGHEVFVHVSSFPNDGQRPRVGESLSFEIEDTERGIAAATAAGIRCLAVPTAMSRHHDFSRAEVVLASMADAVAFVRRLCEHERRR